MPRMNAVLFLGLDLSRQLDLTILPPWAKLTMTLCTRDLSTPRRKSSDVHCASKWGKWSKTNQQPTPNDNSGEGWLFLDRTSSCLQLCQPLQVPQHFLPHLHCPLGLLLRLLTPINLLCLLHQQIPQDLPLSQLIYQHLWLLLHPLCSLCP